MSVIFKLGGLCEPCALEFHEFRVRFKSPSMFAKYSEISVTCGVFLWVCKHSLGIQRYQHSYLYNFIVAQIHNKRSN